jgi:hypothetical protein
MPNTTLNPNDILTKEFDYAAHTALQANEDRVRIFNYYLATAGTVIAAVALAETATPGQFAAFALLFAGLALLGVLFLLQLVKLRLAWTDSVRAMCQIKEYYVKSLGDEVPLASAFRWSEKTIPSGPKPWTVAFLMALTVAVLSSACAGAAVFVWGMAAGGWWVAGAVIAGVAVFAAQVAVWFLLSRG